MMTENERDELLSKNSNYGTKMLFDLAWQGAEVAFACGITKEGKVIITLKEGATIEEIGQILEKLEDQFGREEI